jgi:hypothetical protein
MLHVATTRDSYRIASYRIALLHERRDVVAVVCVRVCLCVPAVTLARANRTNDHNAIILRPAALCARVSSCFFSLCFHLIHLVVIFVVDSERACLNQIDRSIDHRFISHHIVSYRIGHSICPFVHLSSALFSFSQFLPPPPYSYSYSYSYSSSSSRPLHHRQNNKTAQ